MDELIKVQIFIESRYQVNRRRIKKTAQDTIRDNGASTPVEISIAVIGDRKMRELNKKYRNLDKTTNVLSFSQSEGQASPNDPQRLLLGDVVISYPQAIQDATVEHSLVDDKISELVAHGVKHLLGIHH